MNNRFKELEELTDEQLLEERRELEEELERIDAVLEDPNVSSEERSETLNSDLPFARDKKEAVEALIRSRGLERSRN